MIRDSAYDQLKPVERALVDRFVQTLVDGAALRFVPVMEFAPTAAAQALVEQFKAEAEAGRPLVRAAIVQQLRARSAETEINPHRILAELANVAYANMGDYVQTGIDGEPTELDWSVLTPAQWGAVASLEINETKYGRSIKFKLHSKLDALDKLMRYADMYGERGEQIRRVAQTPQVAESATTADAADLYAKTLRRVSP